MTDDFGPPLKPGEKKDRRGAPTYTDKLGREICGRIAAGQSINQIATFDHMPAGSTIRSWLTRDQMEIFQDRFARARKVAADVLVDELLADAEAATPENAHAQRVKVDAKKWAASKMNPGRYGERVDVNVAGRVEHVHVVKEAPEWLQERIKDRGKVIEGTVIPAPDPAPQPKPNDATTH